MLENRGVVPGGDRRGKRKREKKAEDGKTSLRKEDM